MLGIERLAVPISVEIDGARWNRSDQCRPETFEERGRPFFGIGVPTDPISLLLDGVMVKVRLT